MFIYLFLLYFEIERKKEEEEEDDEEAFQLN